MQQNGSQMGSKRAVTWVGLFLGLLGSAALPAFGQDQVAEGTLIKRVEIQGLQTIGEGYARRTIKTRAGQPYVERQVREDVRALLGTRKFLNAFATSRLEDGQAIIVFTVQEKPEILSVELEGNKRFDDDELFKLTPVAGQPIDVYEIRRAREDIERKYKEAGYHYAEVLLDESALQTEGRVIYRVTEGPRVKVRKIKLEGVNSFPELRLKTKIQTKTYWWIFRTGALDEETADRDGLSLQSFYREEGFLDARVGYRLEFDSVDRSDVNLVFVIEEGDRYRVEDIRFSGNEVFSDERLLEVIELVAGSLLRDEVLQADVKRLTDMYGEIGYVDAGIGPRYEFLEEPGVVRLHLEVMEGRHSRFGRITVRGNQRTKDKVIRRELRFFPGEDYNTVQARKAEQRIEETGLFTRATITPLEDVDGFREALVEVEEADTINFLIGVGVSTDSGVLGSLTIENRNFDLFDWPRTWGEFFRGQALRGAGQRLRFQAEPGTQMSRFRIDFREPYLLDKPVALGVSLYLFQRGREAYFEERLGTVISLGRRFEGGLLDGWAIEGALRAERVNISDLQLFPPRDIRDARGEHFLTSVKGSIVRDTTDSRLVPSEGYRLSFSWEQLGALGGDYDFGKPAASFAAYRAVSTDVFDRKSVIAVRADAAYIVGDAPVFERFYGGGFGSIRGFDYRGVSPRAGIFSYRTGGNFILLTGGEYSFPLYAKNVRGVTFLDMGTVEEDFEITTWRASVGFGIRLTINFFGPVPFVFDFGFPIAQDDDDDTRVFNFSFGASF